MNEEQLIKDAQYRKGLSIAFFNATNNATQIMELKDTSNLTEEQIQKQIQFWRDWLLEEHKKYYSEVIANIGKKYDSKETIEKLKTTKSLDELKSVWISLSEDERRDGEIIEATNKLKKQYEEV
jgi:GTPase involved in cell partitioning and DNA repair